MFEAWTPEFLANVLFPHLFCTAFFCVVSLIFIYRSLTILKQQLRIQGPIVELPQFNPRLVKWCAMHCLNLGTVLWICGSSMRSLVSDYDFWGDRSLKSVNDLLATAYQRFRSWSRQNKVQHLVDFELELCFGFIRYWTSPMILSIPTCVSPPEAKSASFHRQKVEIAAAPVS